METLYERINALCESQEIRPGRLCAELNISRSLMTDLKMGRKKGISAETAQKIAAYFHVSVGYLLGTENSPSPSGQTDILDQVDIAFYGEFKELDEQQKETVRDMVRLMREKRTGKPRE